MTKDKKKNESEKELEASVISYLEMRDKELRQERFVIGIYL